MRPRAAVVTATAVTVLLILPALLGCLVGLPTLAPTEPCPDQPGDLSRWAMLARIPLSAMIVLTAVLSIAVAWWGVASPRGRPWPWLAVSLLGLAISAALVAPAAWLISASTC